MTVAVAELLKQQANSAAELLSLGKKSFERPFWLDLARRTLFERAASSSATTTTVSNI
jgi:hypothetical protein